MLAGTLLITPFSVMAESPNYAGDKALAGVMTDSNSNKMLDNLEQKIKGLKNEEKVPVIIQFNEEFAGGKAYEKLAQKLGAFKKNFDYKVFNGMAATMTVKQIELMKLLPFVKQVEYDAPVKINLSTANASFGTEKARSDFGLTGDMDGNERSYTKNDAVVAVIDTGIDAAHADLDGGKVIGWKDLVNNRATAYDDQGHGTHCASIVAGEGDANSANKGVAPGAALVGVKVLDSQGSGSMSTVAAGIDWAVQNKDVYGIEVLSLSLGSSGSSDGKDATSVAVNNASAAGLAVAVAAGNEGPQSKTIGSPGAAEKAITVGAGADLGENGFNLTYFSSRGPTADGRVKPDIFAPGYNITAAKANSGNQYVTYSGTSMATPFTAGTIALMEDANPGITEPEIKNALYSTAIDFGPAGKDSEYGYGRLDGYAAVKAAGGLSGVGPAVPNHFYKGTSISSGASHTYTLNVDNTAFPISLTLITPNWSPGFLIFGPSHSYKVSLVDPTGATVASSTQNERQDHTAYKPTKTGAYKVVVSSSKGSGAYYLDVSAGAASLN
ncbi:peptidase S8 [Fictibacillus aquaticus]|uniref:Peptidase S8 n=2 Tax=Fictibacillus aquaticus TaxID=2021314 RepID=A0A235FFX0_9BACL|nr:peptidase S8 [Fictibacillus aquaticus]